MEKVEIEIPKKSRGMSLSNAARRSLFAAGLYFLVANPVTYSLMESLLGSVVSITDAAGRPTQVGTAIHAVVFGLLTWLLMRFLPLATPVI